MQPQSPKTPNNNHIQKIYKPNKNIKLIINWKKKERWRTSFLFSLPFWSCSFQASTVWQPITCPSSAAISLFFSKIFSENKQINTQKEMSLGVFYLLPINKQTKLSDRWKYGPQFCNKFTMLPLRMRTTQWILMQAT